MSERSAIDGTAKHLFQSRILFGQVRYTAMQLEKDLYQLNEELSPVIQELDSDHPLKQLLEKNQELLEKYQQLDLGTFVSESQSILRDCWDNLP